MPPATSTADWITAISTAAGALFTAIAAVVAIAAVIAAVRAYRTQAAQLELLRQQLADQQAINERQSHVLELQADELRESIAERKRIASDQRRAQAAQVFVTFEINDQGGGTGTETVEVRNSSEYPIYDVRIRWYGPSGDYIPPQVGPAGTIGPHSRAARIGPGETEEWDARVFGTAEFEVRDLRAAAELRDANEVWWIIGPDGRIEEIPEPAHHERPGGDG